MRVVVRPTSPGGVSLQADLTSLLRTGLEYEQAGLPQQAEHVYRQVLAANPGHAEASYLLGGLAERCGLADLALALLAPPWPMPQACGNM